MRIARLVPAFLAAALLPGLAAAGEITGTSTFYWTFTSTNFGAGEAQGYGMGRSVGPRIDGAGAALSTECLELDTPLGGRGVCVHRATAEDSFIVEYVCDQPVDPMPAGAIFACAGTSEAKSGTGRFAGITGSETFVSIGTGFLPDGTVVGYTEVESNFTW